MREDEEMLRRVFEGKMSELPPDPNDQGREVRVESLKARIRRQELLLNFVEKALRENLRELESLTGRR